MSIDAALFSFVTAQASVSTLIGTRFYPGRSPQTPTYPLAVYHRVSSTRTDSLSGDSGLADPRFQISAQSPNYATARSVAEALRAVLSGYQGLMGAIDVRASAAMGDMDIYYDDIGVWQSSFDVFLTHQEN